MSRVLLLGMEGAGKSTLVQQLHGSKPKRTHLRGSTLEVESFQVGQTTWVDTPGLAFEGETPAVQATLVALEDQPTVLVVVRATQLDLDLQAVLPLVSNHPIGILVTHKDRVTTRLDELLEPLQQELQVPILAIQARNLDEGTKQQVLQLPMTAAVPATVHPRTRTRLQVEARKRWIDYPLAAAGIVLLPALVVVQLANLIAGNVEGRMGAWSDWSDQTFQSTPAWVQALLTGDYGLLTMGPLLVVWALPTVLLFSFFLAFLRTTGVLERSTLALHPYLARIGLTGRDIGRIVMGAGCNVPAILQSRTSPVCSRGTCMKTISIGAACSYQFGATLAVFTLIGKPQWIYFYLLAILVTAAVHARWTSGGKRSVGRVLVPRRSFLQAPSLGAIWMDARGTLKGFFVTALPIFLVLSAVASILGHLGVLEALAVVLGPVLALLGLPVEAALPVLFSVIRKDGVLLLAQPLSVGALTAGDAFVALFLAGVLTPCLVTIATILREAGGRFTTKLLAQQVATALVATTIVAWVVQGLGA